MAEQRHDLQPINQFAKVSPPVEAQPVHAGIDHQVAGATARRLPARHLPRRTQHRPRARGQCLRHILVAHAVQDGEVHTVHLRFERCRFAPVGHEEIAAARAFQSLHDAGRTQAIAIGLDRGATGRGAALPRQPAPVGKQRIAIEAQAERSDIASHCPQPIARRGSGVEGASFRFRQGDEAGDQRQRHHDDRVP